MTEAGNRLAGRTALVSGGGNGLGRAIASALGAAGIRVVITGRTARTLDETAALGADAGSTMRTAIVDVADPASVESLRDELADESISILVNTPARSPRSSTSSQTNGTTCSRSTSAACT